MNLYSRFILEERQIDKSNPAEERVKHQAFIPSKKDPRLSVFETNDFLDSYIWELCEKYVEPIRGKTGIARGELHEEDILEPSLGLSIEDEDPPPHHRNILGLNTDESRQKYIAQILAEKAKLFRR